MSYTETDLNLLKSHNKQVRLKVALLNEKYTEVANLVGRIVKASCDITNSSDIRRTANLVLTVDNASYLQYDFESTWIQRMVELSCGIYNAKTKQYVWYAIGRMLMTSGETSYDATTMQVKLSLVDLIGTMTDSRGSQLGYDAKVRAGASIKDAIEATISTFSPFKHTEVPEFEDTVPYDIESDLGQYPIEILKKLLNLFPYYEMFYDSTGTFIVQRIPTKISDPIDLPKNVVNDILISENRNVNFSKVKNTTEIWGRELDADYTAQTVTTSGDCYNVFIADTFEALVVNESYMITPTTDSVAGQKMKIQDTDQLTIYTQKGNLEYETLTEGAMQAYRPYVIKYIDNRFVLQGEASIHVIVQEIDAPPSNHAREAYEEEVNCHDVRWVVNPESPFACTEDPTTQTIIREVRQVLHGGEYEIIYTTQLAIERAGYENWKSTRLQDSVTLEMILVPWLDVNDKLEYTSPTTGLDTVVLVQSVDYDFTHWTMTVKASKFYPYYPFITDEEPIVDYAVVDKTIAA